jgi:hypothetical protein
LILRPFRVGLFGHLFVLLLCVVVWYAVWIILWFGHSLWWCGLCRVCIICADVSFVFLTLFFVAMFQCSYACGALYMLLIHVLFDLLGKV